MINHYKAKKWQQLIIIQHIDSIKHMLKLNWMMLKYHKRQLINWGNLYNQDSSVLIMIQNLFGTMIKNILIKDWIKLFKIVRSMIILIMHMICLKIKLRKIV